MKSPQTLGLIIITFAAGALSGWLAKSTVQIDATVNANSGPATTPRRTTVRAPTTQEPIAIADVESVVSQKILLSSAAGSDRHLEAWTQLIAGMSAENAAQIFAALEPLGRRKEIPAEFFNRVAVRAGELLGAEMVQLDENNHRVAVHGFSSIIEGWARNQPTEVAAWAAELRSGYVKNQAAQGAYRGLLPNNPELAIELYRSMYGQAQWAFADSLRQAYGFEGGIEKIHAIARETAELHNDQAAQQEIALLYRHLDDSAHEQHWQEKVAALLQYADDPLFPDSAWDGALNQAQRVSPAEMLDWVIDPAVAMSETTRTSLQRQAADALVRNHGPLSEGVTGWLESHAEHAMHDQVLSNLVYRAASQDPEAAASWAARAQDENLRIQLQQTVEELQRARKAREE